jgi:hypothetical protein
MKLPHKQQTLLFVVQEEKWRYQGLLFRVQTKGSIGFLQHDFSQLLLVVCANYSLFYKLSCNMALVFCITSIMTCCASCLSCLVTLGVMSLSCVDA